MGTQRIQLSPALQPPSRPVKFILIVNILKVPIELLYKQIGAPTVPSAVIKCQFSHRYATKEGCRTDRKSRNLEYTMGVRLTGFTT
jgi:hypothetical protein